MEQERGHLDQQEDVWLMKTTWCYRAEHMQKTVPSSLPLTMTCFMHSVLVMHSDSKVPFFCEGDMHCVTPFSMTPEVSWTVHHCGLGWQTLWSFICIKCSERNFSKDRTFQRANGPEKLLLCIQRCLDSCITNVWKTWLWFIKTGGLFWDQVPFKSKCRNEIKNSKDGL